MSSEKIQDYSIIYINQNTKFSPKIKQKILKKYNTKPGQLPYILQSDRGIEDSDPRPGDIIKITRRSPTSGESVYYRYVVEG